MARFSLRNLFAATSILAVLLAAVVNWSRWSPYILPLDPGVYLLSLEETEQANGHIALTCGRDISIEMQIRPIEDRDAKRVTNADGTQVFPDVLHAFGLAGNKRAHLVVGVENGKLIIRDAITATNLVSGMNYTADEFTFDSGNEVNSQTFFGVGTEFERSIATFKESDKNK